MWWDHMGGYGGGWMGIGLFTMLLFWLLVILAILALWRGLAKPGGASNGGQKSAMALLEERYARGEIGREEFLQKRADLDGRKGEG